MENMVMNFNNVYAGKKVFLTGHTGFKGSWLLSWLHLLGATVKGYALAPENAQDLYHEISGDTLCDSLIADIRDAKGLAEAIVDFQPDFIFHLAAQPLVIASYQDPLYTYEVNVMGTANVLEAIKLLSKPCIAVMITTDKVYHNYETGQAYQEDDRLGGYDPYSSSKAAAELVIDSYRKSFFNPSNYDQHHKSISVGRAGNVIGGGDWAKDRIIPDIVRALQKNETVLVRNPNAVRPWQHVLEPLSGYLQLGAMQVQEPILFADAFNFGPYLADNLTVKEIVEEAISIWGSGNYAVPENLNARHEAGLLQLDIKKAISKLDWKPRLNAKEAIKNTLVWYKNSFGNKSAKDLIFKDIKTFSCE